MSLTEAIDRINEVTVGSYYTTMYIGMCSFTRKIYDEETTFCKKLRGCSNTHRLPEDGYSVHQRENTLWNVVIWNIIFETNCSL